MASHDDDDILVLRDSRTDTGTRLYWGGTFVKHDGALVNIRTKPYHWGRKGTPDGPLVLLHGPDPRTLT